jgi:CRP/FNR family transcriptional regulator/CRP/FNR family cyclic AMP-dependent transcriptional regulator
MSEGNILSNVPLFFSLKKHDLAELETHLTRRHYNKGDVIFHKDDEGSSLYIITKGTVKIVLPSPQGEEVILAILTTGEIIGELSLIDGHNRSATVEVLEDTEVLRLERQDFMYFLSTRFDAVLQVLEMLTQRLRDTDVLMEEAYFLDITSRVAKKILVLGRQFGVYEGGVIRIGVHITQTDLASMVGTTRESVNKQLRFLRENGLITLEDGFLKILDPVRLARRARTSLGSFT